MHTVHAWLIPSLFCWASNQLRTQAQAHIQEHKLCNEKCTRQHTQPCLGRVFAGGAEMAIA